MPEIVEGQRFPTLGDFKEALRQWAIEDNFTPHILDSDKQRVRAGCRSGPGCPFRIRVNYNIKLHAAKVTTVTNEHTCAGNNGQRLQQNCKRSEIAKLSFLVKAIPELLGPINKETRPIEIIEAIERRYGQRLLHRQAQKAKQYIVRKPCRHCHQFGHISRNCPQRPADAEPDPMDDEDSSSEERPRKRSRCLLCFQTGHNRKNCPQKANLEARNQEAAMIQNQLTTAAYAPNLPPGQRFEGTFGLEPVIEDGSTMTNQDEQEPPGPTGPFPPNRSIDAPPGRPNTRDGGQRRSTAQPHVVAPQLPALPPQPASAQNPRAQAAQLMQQAASLMQEAARLNFEAARLTASLPG